MSVRLEKRKALEINSVAATKDFFADSNAFGHSKAGLDCWEMRSRVLRWATRCLE